MALAKGHSKIRCGPLSDHTKTAIYVAELLTKVSLNRIICLYYSLQFVKAKFKVTEVPSSTTRGDESNSIVPQATASASNRSNCAAIIECEGSGHQRRF